MADEEKQPFTLRVRPLPEKIAYLAGLLRRGEDPMIVAVALDVIAQELNDKAEPVPDEGVAWFEDGMSGTAHFDYTSALKYNIGKH